MFAKSEAEHLEKLARVFDRMRKHGLKLKPQKCHLFQKEITYLGHCISKHGVRKDPEKTCKVEDWPIPNCVRDVRRFLGFSSYFRKFIRDYAKISSPMSSLLIGYSTKRTNRRMNKLKEEELWHWCEEQQASFNKLQKLLVEAKMSPLHLLTLRRSSYWKWMLVKLVLVLYYIRRMMI